MTQAGGIPTPTVWQLNIGRGILAAEVPPEQQEIQDQHLAP